MGSVPDSSQTAKNSFPESMRFRKTWRQYQARILDRLPVYLSDHRLHLVAAPGSGKTVLGLEIVRRLDRPALVLAPTITIRDQWVDRLIRSFLEEGPAVPPWVSVDLNRPGLLTVSTYQALHSICSLACAGGALRAEDGSSAASDSEDENSDRIVRRFPEVLSNAGIRTLVVDEAHHLRAAWWKTLSFVAEQLDRPTVVSLTATPPYDVSPFEWQRYEVLCGPVDAEVSIPELVLAGDICPHQDYVYLSVPEPEGIRQIAAFREGVAAFMQRLLANSSFSGAVLRHPWMAESLAHVADILENPEYLSSMMVYLHAAGRRLPEAALGVVGLKGKSIPAMSLEWLEVLLTRCLYSDAESFPNDEGVLRLIRHELHQIGAIERRKVTLRSPSDHLRLLTTSATKLRSIREIIRLEAEAQQEGGLRAVVLTDFIRKEETPKTSSEEPRFEDIGVVPIFETLRNAQIPSVRLGILSGSLVMVPAAALESVRAAARAAGIRDDDLTAAEALHDRNYVVLSLRGEYAQGMVRLVTSVFHEGAVNVLIGTKSLLGEGWDAPCINALVLASFVGSYVLSNQMRGRAIRMDPEHAAKTANIWHLVCVEPGPFGPGADYELLVRRCAAFAGVNATAPAIESGTNRMGIGSPPFGREQVDVVNRETAARAADRAALNRQWKHALGLEGGKQMVDGVQLRREALPAGFVLTSTVASLLFQAGSLFLLVLSEALRVLGRSTPRSGHDWLTLALIVFGIAALVSLPWTCLAVWRWARHGTPEGSVKQIGRAVLDALVFAGVIDSRAGDFRIYADRNEDGTVFCWIGGGAGKEQSVFLDAMRQTLRPIGSPRYLLARNRVWRVFCEDYFAVPDEIGRKKEVAEYYAKRWRSLVGPVQLVFTRTTEGRRLLLRARGHSLAAAFQQRSDRVSCWK